MKTFIYYIFAITLLFSNENKVIHLITTNDIHGNIAEQKAYFMNPSYPPTIVGGAGYSKYLSELRDQINLLDEGIILLDGVIFSKVPILV